MVTAKAAAVPVAAVLVAAGADAIPGWLGPIAIGALISLVSFLGTRQMASLEDRAKKAEQDAADAKRTATDAARVAVAESESRLAALISTNQKRTEEELDMLRKRYHDEIVRDLQKLAIDMSEVRVELKHIGGKK